MRGVQFNEFFLKPPENLTWKSMAQLAVILSLCLPINLHQTINHFVWLLPYPLVFPVKSTTLKTGLVLYG
jgi:hypothetical protein